MHFLTGLWLCGIVFCSGVSAASVCSCHTATAWDLTRGCTVASDACVVIMYTRIPPSVTECPTTPTVTSSICPTAGGCVTTYIKTVVSSDCVYENNPGRPTPTVTTVTQTFTSTRTSPATPSATGLSIIAAIYGDVDVTDKATAALQQGSRLVVDMSNIANWVGADPMVGSTKCLSLLHAFGSSIRTFVACERDGTFTLVPGDVKSSPRTQEITRQGPRSRSFSIVSVVWGSQEIRTAAVYQSIYNAKRNGSAIPFSNDVFGSDTLENVRKTGVIWYTEDDFRTVKNIHAKEGVSVGF